MQQLNHILNSLPKSEVGLVLGKWKTVRPALIRVLRAIDIFRHPEEIFEDDEAALEEALELSKPPITSPDWIISNIAASLFHNTYPTFNFFHFIYFILSSSYLNPQHSPSDTSSSFSPYWGFSVIATISISPCKYYTGSPCTTRKRPYAYRCRSISLP